MFLALVSHLLGCVPHPRPHPVPAHPPQRRLRVRPPVLCHPQGHRPHRPRRPPHPRHVLGRPRPRHRPRALARPRPLLVSPPPPPHRVSSPVQAALLLGTAHPLFALHRPPPDAGSSLPSPPLRLTDPLQGSTYIYTSLLGPWLAKNEADIDDAMVSAQANAIAMCRARIAALVDLVASALNSSVLPRAETDPHKPAQPLASPVDQLARVLAAYAPSAFAPKDSSDAHVSATASQQSHQSYSAN